MLGNIGPFELGFLLIFLLLIFGAKRLPELGAGLGKGIREFKKSMNDIHSEIERPVDQTKIGNTSSTQPTQTIQSGENKDA